VSDAVFCTGGTIMSQPLRSCTALVAAFAFASPVLAAPVEIEFWTPSLGAISPVVEAHVKQFNESQSDYKVVIVNKGSYDETLNAIIAAYRARKHPALTIAVGASTQTMMLSGAIVPVQQVMAEAGKSVDWSGFVQPVLNYFRTTDGQLLSMPFNSSTPLFWYNVDAFAKAGLREPPKTWDQVGEYAAKLRAAGYECGYTSAWQVWVNIDNYSFINDQPVATRGNGMQGIDAKFLFNETSVAKHTARLQEWATDGRFQYTGRQWQGPHAAFLAEKCAMMTESSAGYAGIAKGAKFKFAATYLPLETGVAEGRNSLIGGGAIWTLKGHKPEHYKAVAEFLAFLTKPEIQADWHKQTGYVPITRAAYELVKKEGYYEKNPHQELAILQLSRTNSTDNTKAVRLGNYPQYVAAIEEELENIWAQKKTAQQGLDDAVRRGNEILRRFEAQAKTAQ
jgi:sn-glycerol 3-phosphate transport system substrate-binding protein